MITAETVAYANRLYGDIREDLFEVFHFKQGNKIVHQ